MQKYEDLIRGSSESIEYIKGFCKRIQGLSINAVRLPDSEDNDFFTFYFVYGESECSIIMEGSIIRTAPKASLGMFVERAYSIMLSADNAVRSSFDPFDL